LAPVSAISSTAPEPIRAFIASISAGRSLPDTPVSTCATNLTPPISFASGPPAAAHRQFARSCATSLASARRSSASAARGRPPRPRGLQRGRDLGQPRILRAQMVQRRLPGQRLDPPHPGG
jgi:hypothetical protein